MKYRVTHTESGEEVHEGDAISDFRGDKFTFEGVLRGPDQCLPHQTPKVVVSQPRPDPPGVRTSEFYASVFDLEILEDTRRAFRVVVTVDPTKGDYNPFRVGDVEHALNVMSYPYGTESGALKFEVEEVPL